MTNSVSGSQLGIVLGFDQRLTPEPLNGKNEDCAEDDGKNKP